MGFDAKDYLNERKKVVNSALLEYLPPDKPQTKLLESVIYSIYPGGKRLRPVLCLAASELVCGNHDGALPLACAIEMVHTYSMIHDDLPSMDDDDTRRSVPTNHRVFGEAVATLAGDALLTDAFSLLAKKLPQNRVSSELALRAVSLLADAAGSKGMVLGQAFDLEMNLSLPSEEEVLNTYLLKTAKMITASVVGGATVAGAREDELRSLQFYSEKIGVAFQIKDDLLDSHNAADKGGENAQKHTYPSLLGINAAREKVFELTDQAIKNLAVFEKNPNPLKEIALWLSERDE
ncbi:MAG: polyprenyl synthetase family protein [Candidatus Dadabacteria bacterium]|nr:polyprenyl synthetase family protein [Candidatus Dadabacteria bacterium]